jgi:TPR repeat protein
MRIPLLLLTLLFAGSAAAGALDDGLAAYTAGDYQRAFDAWKPLAEAGDADAQYNIGLLYMNGQGVAKNSRFARQLFMAAAEQGQPDAQYNLGLMYYQGNTVFRSNKDAFTWWQKAAAQNHAPAQYNLGFLYAYGIWVGRDVEKALTLWEASAAQGNRDAMQALARVYENGEFGIGKDADKAAYWRERLGK